MLHSIFFLVFHALFCLRCYPRGDHHVLPDVTVSLSVPQDVSYVSSLCLGKALLCQPKTAIYSVDGPLCVPEGHPLVQATGP